MRGFVRWKGTLKVNEDNTGRVTMYDQLLLHWSFINFENIKFPFVGVLYL